MCMTTATIRVSAVTRDLLALEARERGMSLASFLAEVAEERRRAALWESERAASIADADSPAAQAEIADWESTLGDGIA